MIKIPKNYGKYVDIIHGKVYNSNVYIYVHFERKEEM